MSNEMLIAIVAGIFSIGGAVVGACLTLLGSFLEHKRTERRNEQEQSDREYAVLHGAFAVCNFIASRLNEWDRSRGVHSLVRLAVAQPYVSRLIELSPKTSARVMVSLVDLGLKLETLMLSAGFATGEGDQTGSQSLEVVLQDVDELSAAVDLVQILVSGELPFVSEEEIEKMMADHTERDESR